MNKKSKFKMFSKFTSIFQQAVEAVSDTCFFSIFFESDVRWTFLVSVIDF